jgi:hypothetical protein
MPDKNFTPFFNSLLRVDIQTLQTPEWNEQNYTTVLAPVVAEIWRSFMERRLITVLSEERARRLGAELELERIRTATEEGVFSRSEESDFSFIWKQFDRYHSVRFVAVRIDGENEQEFGKYDFEVSVRSLVPHLDEIMDGVYEPMSLNAYFQDLLSHELPKAQSQLTDTVLKMMQRDDFASELLAYGFLRTESGTETTFRGELRPVHNLVFTEKMQRFKYWLIHKNHMPAAVEWRKGDDAAGHRLAQRFPTRPPETTQGREKEKG